MKNGDIEFRGVRSTVIDEDCCQSDRFCILAKFKAETSAQARTKAGTWEARANRNC